MVETLIGVPHFCLLQSIRGNVINLFVNLKFSLSDILICKLYRAESSSLAHDQVVIGPRASLTTKISSQEQNRVEDQENQGGPPPLQQDNPNVLRTPSVQSDSSQEGTQPLTDQANVQPATCNLQPKFNIATLQPLRTARSSRAGVLTQCAGPWPVHVKVTGPPITIRLLDGSKWDDDHHLR